MPGVIPDEEYIYVIAYINHMRLLKTREGEIETKKRDRNRDIEMGIGRGSRGEMH